MPFDLPERPKRTPVGPSQSSLINLVRHNRILSCPQANGPERIANSERYLDMAKANNQRAEDKASELKQLNKSIFRPVIVWNKVGFALLMDVL